MQSQTGCALLVEGVHPGLPGTDPADACHSDIIILRASVHSQPCPDMDSNYTIPLVIGRSFPGL